MTTNQDSPNTAGAAEPVAWRVDDLTARGEVCGCFELYTDYEKVEQHVAEGGVRFTKVTPLYAHPPENPPQRTSVVPDEVVEAVAQFLHDEGGFDEAWDATWPEHPDDTGQREGGFVRIVPSDVQAKFRDVARRLCTMLPINAPTAAIPMTDLRELIERIPAAIKTTEYKYFGDYEMSDGQREAVDVLVAAATALTAAIPAIKAQVLAEEWKPIKSAPKDGTPILCVVRGVYEPTGKPFHPDVAYWDGDEWTGTNWEVDGEKGSYKPTHWMPLPPPPNAIEQDANRS